MNLAIHPKERGKGPGRRLITSVLNYGKISGVESVHLEVRESNNEAINLYKSLGSKQILFSIPGR